MSWTLPRRASHQSASYEGLHVSSCLEEKFPSFVFVFCLPLFGKFVELKEFLQFVILHEPKTVTTKTFLIPHAAFTSRRHGGPVVR